jgi:hypothetical protein
MAILRLRLLCNHGTLGHPYQPNEVANIATNFDETLTLLQQSDQAICTYCSCEIISLSDSIATNSGTFSECKHLFCNECFIQYEEEIEKTGPGETKLCPICGVMSNLRRKGEGQNRGDEAQIMKINVEDLHVGKSAKLAKLLEDVRQHRHSDKRYEWDCFLE